MTKKKATYVFASILVGISSSKTVPPDSADCVLSWLYKK